MSLVKKYITETKKAINKKFAFCDRTFVSLIVILINLRFSRKFVNPCESIILSLFTVKEECVKQSKVYKIRDEVVGDTGLEPVTPSL